MDIAEAVRLNASMLAVMVAIGSEHEALTIRNLTATIDAGSRCGIPTLGVTAVGKELVRDARYLSLASRVCAENGAHVVKTYYCDEGFEKVAASCPVPIVIAGGKKLPELDALKMARGAIDQGACGVDMGRNIFQADDPIAMIQAVRAVVHGNESAAKGMELYNTLKNEKSKSKDDAKTRLPWDRERQKRDMENANLRKRLKKAEFTIEKLRADKD
jgi:putative autoinducer-2 (AI-2) aldolase